MHKYIIRRYNYNYYKIFKIAPTSFGSQGSITRELYTVLVLHSLDRHSLDCAVHTRTMGKYAAITPTTSISTVVIEPLLQF